MNILTREAVTKSAARRLVEVDVTEWGEIDPKTNEPKPTKVFVREMSGRERDEFESGMIVGKGKNQKVNIVDLRARMAVLVCCDEKGNLIFKPEDVSWLTNKSVRPLSRIYNAAKLLNDLSDEDEDELLKNSQTTIAGNSGATSP